VPKSLSGKDLQKSGRVKISQSLDYQQQSPHPSNKDGGELHLFEQVMKVFKTLVFRACKAFREASYAPVFSIQNFRNSCQQFRLALIHSLAHEYEL